MAILKFQGNTAGQVGRQPRTYTIHCTDSYAEVTSANWFQGLLTCVDPIKPDDKIEMLYGADGDIFGIFRPVIDGNDITLFMAVPNVTLPVVDKDIAVFDGTAGTIKDGGFRVVSGTLSWAGGSSSHAFTLTGLTTAYKLVVGKRSSANTSEITGWAITTDTLTVSFSADPGAVVMDFIGTSIGVNI